MLKITAKIDGMQCGMCEAHVNDAIRSAFSVKKVSSSHTKNQMVILTEQEINEQELKAVLDATGYHLVAVEKEPYQKKGFFSVFQKQ